MNNQRSIWLVIGDFACFGVGLYLFLLGVYGYHGFAKALDIHAFPMAILAIIWMVVFYVFNFYDLRHTKPDMLFVRKFIISAVICLGIGFIFFYINPLTRITPKSNLLIFEALSFICIFGFRRLFHVTSLKSTHTRLAIVCSEEKYHPLVSEINNNPQLGFETLGTFKSMQDFILANVPADLLIIHNIHESESALLEKVLASHIEVIDLAKAYETILYKIPIDFIDNQWLIHSITKNAYQFDKFIARVISLVFALIVGIVTLPISLAIIIAIKLEDRGPILYKNDRVGIHGKPFFLYKFRSMVINAENGKAVWATGDHDPRITKVGRITRKLHIDEIPQLLNIIKGDITLVGPRPERPEFVAQLEKEVPYYFMRHTISPGFTGWAQIKFRYARTVLDSQEKFEYDLFYIKNRNVFLDIGIILKTVQIIFTHAGK